MIYTDEIEEYRQEQLLAEEGAFYEAMRMREEIEAADIQRGRCQKLCDQIDKDICPSCGCTGDSIAHLVCLERARRLGPVPF